MSQAVPQTLTLRQWRDMDPAQQRQALEASSSRQGVLADALSVFAPRLLHRPPGDEIWHAWLDLLILAGHGAAMPAALLRHVLLARLAVLDRLPQDAAAAWPNYAVYPAPQPMDVELDLLNQALERKDLQGVALLGRSMAGESEPRRLLVRRLQTQVCADNFREGQRLIFADAVADLETALDAEAFTAVYLTAVFLHFQSPAGAAVVVPEGRASGDPDTQTPLLVSLRARNLSAFLQRIRALGDEPVAGMRQLLLAMALLILERGVPDGEECQRLARIYLRLAALLKMHHPSRRLARRAFFAAAVQVFELAGWTPDPRWPDYTALLHAYQAADGGTIQGPLLSWQAGLHSLRSGRFEEWLLELAEVVGTRENAPLFWPVWVQARQAMDLAAAPLAWVNALVPLRLYGDA